MFDVQRSMFDVRSVEQSWRCPPSASNGLLQVNLLDTNASLFFRLSDP